MLASPVASVRSALLEHLAACTNLLLLDTVPMLLDCLDTEPHPEVLQQLLQLLWQLPMAPEHAPRLWGGARAVQQRTLVPEVCTNGVVMCHLWCFVVFVVFCNFYGVLWCLW